MGVAPPSAAAMSGVAAMGTRGVGVDVTGGRGGILTAVGAPMMPGGVTSPTTPRVEGDWGGGGSAAKARRPKPRVSGGGKKEEPKVSWWADGMRAIDLWHILLILCVLLSLALSIAAS